MKYESPYDDFHDKEYLLHNQSRFDHLDSLNIDFENKSVLEVGAGIGDHTEFLLRYNPERILSLEAREDNTEIHQKRFRNNPNVQSLQFNMDAPFFLDAKFDICYCYGLLYHLANPEKAIDFMSDHTEEIFLLETCVDYFNENSVNTVSEDKNLYSQSYNGIGCRPGRKWLYKTISRRYEYVYMPKTQPDHVQFPTDWSAEKAPNRLTRAIFVASRFPVDNPQLTVEVPQKQVSIKPFR